MILHPVLTLRLATAPCICSEWQQHEDYDVFDANREIGRIYLVDGPRYEAWFWGVSFQVIKRKSYGYASSMEEAKASFWAEYLAWRELKSPPLIESAGGKLQT